MHRALGIESLELRELLSADALGCACGADLENGWLIEVSDPSVDLTDTFVSLEPVAPGWVRGVTRCDLQAAAADELFASLPAVTDVERDTEIKITSLTVNDPRGPELYGLTQLEAQRAWDNGAQGQWGTVVAVLDTGVDINHPDLAPNIWMNPRETANGIDDDGNGFIDDISGWDFSDNDSSPLDPNGHGTHVAGTIGAVADNGLGVVGVAPHTKLLPVRFLDAGGTGSLFDAVRAISYVTGLKRSGVNVVAINASWGSTDSRVLDAVVREAAAAGILFVAAAGNAASNNDVTPVSPANIEAANVISVAATDAAGNLATFSNYGPQTVDVAAPGVGILSTIPGGGYGSLSGTSMAAPHVSGVVAVIASKHPEWSATEIRDAIFSSGDPLTTLSGRIASGRRVNAARAVVGEPAPPTPLPPGPPPPPPPVFLDGGTLRITTAGGNDSVTIGQEGREAYVVTANGVEHRFRWSEILRVAAFLGAGDDYFSNDSDLPSEVHGEDGNDTLIGGKAADRLFGEAGADLLLGREGFDVLRGGKGDDELRGGSGGDRLLGGAGKDTLIGGRGDDTLDGGSGVDRLYADAADTLQDAGGDRVVSR